MKKIELKKGGYYSFFKEPGMPCKIIEETDKQYKISICLKNELTLSKTAFDNLIKKNEFRELTKDEAERLAFAWLI